MYRLRWCEMNIKLNRPRRSEMYSNPAREAKAISTARASKYTGYYYYSTHMRRQLFDSATVRFRTTQHAQRDQTPATILWNDG